MIHQEEGRNHFPNPILTKHEEDSTSLFLSPTANQYVFAFVLPLSLIAITFFTSIRISDKLDNDYLEEVAINQAIRETDEDDEADLSSEEKSALPRSRNRPKREV